MKDKGAVATDGGELRAILTGGLHMLQDIRGFL